MPLSELGSIATAWFQMPVTVTQNFGCTGVLREIPFGDCPHYHHGIDLQAPMGTPILSGVEGTIVAVGDDVDSKGRLIGFGHKLLIRPTNADTTITLGHLKDQLGNNGIKLQPGDGVHVGDIVGHVGSTGNSSGPHLHFETRTFPGAISFDPTDWILGTAIGQATAPLAGDTAAQRARAAPSSGPSLPDFSAVLGKLGNLLSIRTAFIALGIGLMGAGLLLYFRREGEVAVIHGAEAAA